MNHCFFSKIAEDQSSRIRAWSRVLILGAAALLLSISARVVWLKTTNDPQLINAAGVHRSTAPELA